MKCNLKVKYQECYSCTSENDLECAKNSECAKNFSACAIEIDEKGFTHRKCINKSNLDKKLLSNNNFTCDEDKCNVEIFPKDRLKCYYQCNGDQDCSLDTSLKPEPCRTYTKDDQCFTYIDGGEIQ